LAPVEAALVCARHCRPPCKQISAHCS